MKAEDPINWINSCFICILITLFTVTDILVVPIEDKRSWRESVAEQGSFV